MFTPVPVVNCAPTRNCLTEIVLPSAGAAGRLTVVLPLVQLARHQSLTAAL